MIVEGGETFHLGSGLSVRVIRWHHSGDPSTPFGRVLQIPMELIDVPKPDSVTGGLKPSSLDDFPNGGGARAYLFTLNKTEGKITWFYSNSGNATTFKRPVTIDEAFLRNYGLTLNNLVITSQEKSVEENLVSVMTVEGLVGIVWLALGLFGLIFDLLKKVVPHWLGALLDVRWAKNRFQPTSQVARFASKRAGLGI